MLSAGYFGFFGHAGVLAALEARGLAPSAYAGTSAGALVGAMAAAGMPAQAIADRLSAVGREDFWDPSLRGLGRDLARGGATGILRGERFRALLEQTLPVAAIEDCAKPLVVVTSDLTRAEPRVHARGPLAEAVHASCAYPGLFRAVEVDGSQLWDGGLIDKAPIVALLDAVPALDAVLVVYLPSDTKARAAASPRRHHYVSGLMQGLAAVRHEHYVLQARLAEARGVAVHELSPALPAVGPGKLEVGPRALAEATRVAGAWLDGEDEARPYAARRA